MIVLPVISRELRVAARRPGTYRTRLWAAVAATILLAWSNLMFSWQGQTQASLGQTLFHTISGLAFFYCLLIGARVTSDCVSEEKREGTLGLLFLTDLKGRHVILGKFFASSLSSFYGLLGIFPMLAIPLLLGGITLIQVGQMALVLIDTLFLSLAAGVFVSTISRNERKAMFATLLMVFFLALSPIMAALLWMFTGQGVQNPVDLEIAAAIIFPTPIWAFTYVLWPSLSATLRIPWSPPSWSFWYALVLVHILAWAVLVIASRLLPFIWKDRSREKRVTNWTQSWLTWIKNPEAHALWRLELLRINPYLWLVLRDRFKVYYPWLFLLGVAATWMWGYFQYRDVMFDTYPAIPTALLIHGFVKLWILSESSQRLVDDYRSGALEMLLCTPLPVSAILEGQFLALRRQFGWPLLALGLIEVAVFRGWFSLEVILCLVTITIADALTLAWVGMYLSLSGKNLNRVLWVSTALVLLLPWAVYLLSLGLWNVVFSGDRYVRMQFSYRVGLWFVIGLLFDFALAFCWARPRLRKFFRNLALQHSERIPAESKRWLGVAGWRGLKQATAKDP